MSDYYLEVEGLQKWFPIVGGVLGRTKGYVKAVNGVTLRIRRGETYGLVGESGSGKTTIGRCLLRLIEPTGGKVLVEGTDITRLKPKEFKPFRRKMQIIFQDPYASLDGRQTIKGALMEAMRSSGAVTDSATAYERAKALISRVGLNEDHLYRFPHEFSGGQRQRIAVARALATNPEFIVLDEPTSFLDVSVQAQILNLLLDLQKEFRLTFLFISHNLSVIEHMSNRVGVLYLGKLMEVANTQVLYRHPSHPYTYALMDAIPIPNPAARREQAPLSGEVPSILNLPTGCVFNGRCKYAQERCVKEEPPLRDMGENHSVACHFAEQFSFETVINRAR